MSCGNGEDESVLSQEYGTSASVRFWSAVVSIGVDGVMGVPGVGFVGELESEGEVEEMGGIWRVSGEVGDVGAAGGGGDWRGSRVVGEGLMKREISSGVVSGVTFSTTVQEGRRRTVVGWGLLGSVWWWWFGGGMLDAEIMSFCPVTFD